MKNALEIFKALPGTNCRECLTPSCLAFAVAVFKGDRRIGDCPHVDSSLVRCMDAVPSARDRMRADYEKMIGPLREKVSQVDFPASVERLGAELSGGDLVIKCLGKDFSVSADGTVRSIVHVHPYVTVPLLNYVISCKGTPPTGNWVRFRELQDGVSWGPLFQDQFEAPMRRIADRSPDLFDMMMSVFGGRPVPSPVGADVSVVIHPLPKLPMLVCYWQPQEGMESALNVLLDSTAEDNLDMESIFTMGVGLVRMFEKVVDSHG